MQPRCDKSAHTYYGAAVGPAGGQTNQQCSSSSYGFGYPILAIDEAGNKRQSWVDGFGKIIETDEPNASGTLANLTCFAYDLNNNLTGATYAGGLQQG